MTKDEIIAMAKEAGIDFEPGQALNGQVLDFTDGSQSLGRMTRFAELVAAKEREACALACDKAYYQFIGPEHGEVRHGVAACAAAIRARGAA